MTPAPAFVLVHGDWHGARHGAWHDARCRMLYLLRAQGCEAHAVTRTGVGERARLLSPEVPLTTHVADLSGLIEAVHLPDEACGR